MANSLTGHYVNAQAVTGAANMLSNRFTMLSGNDARIIARAFADLRNSEIALVDNTTTRDEQEQHRQQFFAIVELVVNAIACQWDSDIDGNLHPDDSDNHRIALALVDWHNGQ